MKKRTSVTVYDNNGHRLFSIIAKRVDITDNVTVLHLCENGGSGIIRVVNYVKSTTVMPGIITVYYCNDGYLEITKID